MAISSRKGKFNRFNTGDTNVDRNLVGIEQSLNNLYENDLPHGIEFEDIALSTSDVIIKHTLGKTAKFIITDINANATIWKTGSTKDTITLQASATVTVSLYIY
tara:strand:+ start:1536 stop:1847 length:312 start_codon:yes stop_codon:yes gene_type:complete